MSLLAKSTARLDISFKQHLFIKRSFSDITVCSIHYIGLPDAILRVVFTVNVTAKPFPCQPAHWRGPHHSIVEGEGGHREHRHK